MEPGWGLGPDVPAPLAVTWVVSVCLLMVKCKYSKSPSVVEGLKYVGDESF